MTHSVAALICSKLTPPLNPHIMRGLAVPMLKDNIKYVVDNAKRYLDNAVPGLKFEGYAVCTPQEEYDEVTRLRSNRRTFDCTHSYIRMIRLDTSFEDQSTSKALSSKYLYVPYTEDGAILMMSGSTFHIKSVLTNKVISPGPKSLFVRMLGTKKYFNRSGYSIKVDGQTKTAFVVHSEIYDAGKKKKESAVATKAYSTMVHYLLLKFGFDEAFKRYLGHIPVVGMEDEITPDHYPQEDWVIVSTAYKHVKPHGFVEPVYTPTKLRLAVRRDKWDQATVSFVSEFFYVVDHFPTSFNPRNVNDTKAWLLLMGYILIGADFTVGKINDLMNDHLDSLDDFVDDVAVDKLHEKGHDVKNFFDLAAMLTIKFPELLAENDSAGNIYQKYYDVMYHVMKPITYALNNLRYTLQRSSKRSFQLSWNNVNTIMVRKLSPGAVFNITRDSTVAETVSYCGDHWYPRLTSKVEEQEKSSASGRGKAGSSEANFLHYSMIEGGSLLFLPKSDPTPVANINPYAEIDLKTGSIIPNPQLKDTLERTRLKLERK